MREEPTNTSNSSIIRVHKDKNYTVMSNKHLFQKELSLKAKGLLCLILALPDDWNYSIAGLCKIIKEGKDSLNAAISELKKFGYVEIERQNAEAGRFSFVYHIFEQGKTKKNDDLPNTDLPCTGFPYTVKPNTDEPCTENPQQLNTKELSTNNQDTNKPKEEKPKEEKPKISFGEFNNVFLTTEETVKLKDLYKTNEKFNEGVEILSSYKEASGKKYKSDYAVLNRNNWVYGKVFPNKTAKQTTAKQESADNNGKYSKCY